MRRWIPRTFSAPLFQYISSRVGEIFFVLGSVLLTMLPMSPWNMVNTGRDSGVFLYIGWRILNGAIPYRDIWDHKPPVIFYLNALGVALSGNSRWGIWFIELVFLSLAAWLGFSLCRKVFGRGPAFIASFLWLLTLEFVIEGGNLTTEYTLLMQFGCLALFYRAEEKPSPWLWFLLGVLTALAFFTKQNTIGIGLAILIYLGLDRIRSRQSGRLMKEVGLFALGGVTVSAIVVLFFAAHGALADFWSAAVEYNFSYVFEPMGIKARLRQMMSGVERLTVTGLFQIALIGYVMGVLALLYKAPEARKWRTLLVVGVLDLPLELILVDMSGRGYFHYYMTLLPVLAVLSGAAFGMLFSLLASWTTSKAAQAALTVGSLLVLAGGSYADYRAQADIFRDTEPGRLTIYLQTNTSSEDYVLLWGAETGYNFLAQRRSPTRFVYQYPLYAEGYTTPEMVEEFLEDILRTRPIIIDTQNPETPLYQFPVTSERIQANVSFLQAHYCPVDQFGNWAIYKYSEMPCR